MGPVVVQAEISLDGFISQEGTPFFAFCRSRPEDLAQARMFIDLLGQAGVHVVGRVTYEAMAQYFPTVTHDGNGQPGATAEIARLMNTIPKAVLSATLPAADWGPAEILRGDTAAELDALRRRVSGDVLVNGGASLMQSVISLDIVDEYRFGVMPYLAGSGVRPFGPGGASGAGGAGRELELISSTAFANQEVLMRYRRRR